MSKPVKDEVLKVYVIALNNKMMDKLFNEGKAVKRAKFSAKNKAR